MIALNKWAQRNGVSPSAMLELSQLLGYGAREVSKSIVVEQSEAAAQQLIRVDAPHHNARLFRNNCGAFKDDRGNFIRYGLANESAPMSKVLKSSDLIGITAYTVTVGDVGSTVGLFTSIEVKKPGWKYKGDARESAQLAWINLIISLGGRAQFATGPDDVRWV